MTSRPGEIVTLEPLIAAIREGVEGAGWLLSGLQKTTSHEFEGRWAGESSRSAYVFFHREDLPEWVSLEVFLDETSRGLRGNLALVVDGPSIEALPSAERILESLGTTSKRFLPRGYRTPISLRYYRLDPEDHTSAVETEYRLKLHIPRAALSAGSSAVVALVSTVTEAFETALRSAELRPLLMGE